ncbi:hypothetical protein [Methylobacterium sp. SD274]|uniref:hypothetical protein n=1 Tax=Methylobacterium sp. SD274 TaxID=2782009 RepID=UPI001FEDC6EB|nr:hypothetical protein [Methylobacterium sp. SD274]
MTWGTRTIGGGEIARAQGQARHAVRIVALSGTVPCGFEAGSVRALKDAGAVPDEAATAADGTLTLWLVRDERDGLLARALPDEGPTATLLRLLTRDAAWEAAHARMAKARQRAAAPFTPKAELVALTRAALAERDRAAAGTDTSGGVSGS